MLTHNLKFAFRNLRKYKSQSLVGIFGLAVALALFVLGSYWYRYENSYDMFYPDAERIRLMISHDKEDLQEWATEVFMPLPMAEELVASFPEIEMAARSITQMGGDTYQWGSNFISVNPYFVDAAYIDMLTFDYVEGSKYDVLRHWVYTDNPNIILTESIARKLFGNEPAIGKTVTSVQSGTQNTVLAVIRDVPQNSNFQYNVLTPIPFEMLPPWWNTWDYFSAITYVKLKPNINEQALKAKLANHMVDRGWRRYTQLDIVPLSDIRRRFNEDFANVKFKIYPVRFGYIVTFAVAGLLILLCAYINFLTLALSRFMENTKELGIRKVFGAKRFELNTQLLTSLAVETLCAALVSALLVMALTPLFSSFVYLDFRFGELAGWLVICLVAGLLFTLLVGLLPVHYISALRVRLRGRNTAWRKSALTVQLFIGALFIFCVVVVSRQFFYMQNTNLGFDRSNIVEITKPRNVDWAVFKAELEANPNIVKSTIVRWSFFGQMGTQLNWEGQSVEDSLRLFRTNSVDVNFIDFFNIRLQAGEFFNPENPDPAHIVINQTAANIIGFENPVGQFVNDRWGGGRAQIVGVVSDFHVSPLRQPIEPMILRYPRNFSGNTHIKVNHAGIQPALEHIRTTFEQHASPGEMFSYQFMDDEYARFNRSEQAMLSVFGIMAIVCLLISAFGIYSMIALSTLHRRKEIAIRKVSGAETVDIVKMFLREYLMLGLIANIIALPVAYWLMSQWLQDYAYRVNIAWWVFAAVLGLTFVVVLSTVLRQVLKAANRNPAEVVKGE